MDIVKERERVAEMCASCEIEYLSHGQWIARMWCNEIGEKIVGGGFTAWEAVQAAHAIHAMQVGK